MSFATPLFEPAFTVRDGVRLAHFDAGPPAPGKPPLLLVNGWTGDHGIFTPQIARFSRERRVVAVNLRGHGRSDAPDGEYTVTSFADDIAFQCDAIDLEKPVVVGHSGGGIISLELCGRHPALASGLVMIDSPVLLPPAPEDSSMLDQLLQGIAGPDYLAVSRRNAWSIGCDYDDPARRQEIFDTYILGPCLTTPQHVAFSALRNLALHDLTPAARACSIPMAYISADVPVITALRSLDRLRAVCPQLVFAQTLLAGHFNTIEVADQVNAMIKRFLDVGLQARDPAEALELRR